MQTPSAAGYGFGYSPTEVGLMMLPIAAAMLIASPLAARIGRRYPRLPLQFDVVDVLIGAGYGLAFASVGNLVVNAVEPHHTGMATGVNTIARTVGGAVGAQLAAAILTGSLSESGYVTAFTVFAVVAVLALATAFAIPTARRVPAYAAA